MFAAASTSSAATTTPIATISATAQAAASTSLAATASGTKDTMIDLLWTTVTIQLEKIRKTKGQSVSRASSRSI